MALTQQQLTALKTDILAQGSLATAVSTRDGEAIAAFYKTQASPAFTVWKTQVSIGEVGKSFNGAELAGLTTANLTRLQTIAMYLAAGVNPSIAGNRQFFDDVFSGAGGTNTRAALLVLWKRLANRAEKLFATGTGSDAVPATMAFEGEISSADALNALDSN